MSISEEDRKRILQRDDLHPMDRWLIEECYPFHHSHLHVAHGLFARYIEDRPVGDWMTTAGGAIHNGAHAIAAMAGTVTSDADTSYFNKLSAASLLIVLSRWSRSIRYDLENVRLLIDLPTKDDADLTYVRFITIILDHDEVWKEVKSDVRTALEHCLKLLKSSEITSLQSKHECRKALKLIGEHYIKRNEEARRRDQRNRAKDQS